MRGFRFDADVDRLWATRSAAEIAAQLGCSVATVYHAAHRRQLDVRKRAEGHRWTPADDHELRRLYPLLRPAELEQHFGLVYEQVRTRAKRLGLASRLSSARGRVRHDFFGGQTPVVAYFAGLLAADGWVTSNRPDISLGLKVSDRAMVDRFAAEVVSPRPVAVYRGIARATVTSDQMVADLRDRWRVAAAKTYSLQPPDDEHDLSLQLAYIAGHLDGDGFISSPRARNGAFLRCGAIGTEAVIRWCAGVLDQVLADAGRGRSVSVRRVGGEKYWFPMFEWRTSDHSAVVILDSMKSVIGELGIERKWTTYETARARYRVRRLMRAA